MALLSKGAASLVPEILSYHSLSRKLSLQVSYIPKTIQMNKESDVKTNSDYLQT